MANAPAQEKYRLSSESIALVYVRAGELRSGTLVSSGRERIGVAFVRRPCYLTGRGSKSEQESKRHMTDFFREVDEEVRRDKAVQIWQRYQFLFLGLAFLIIAGTGGYRLWQNQKTEAEQSAGAKYEAAQQLSREGKSAEAQAAFEALAKDGPAGYRILALLRAADELSTRDPAAAIKAYDTLAGNPALDTAFQDVARLRAAILRVDATDPKEAERSLVSLAGPTSAYRNSARELLALAALKRDDFEAAGRWLDQIVVDPQTPANLRQRAEAFLGLVQAGKPVAAKPLETKPAQAGSVETKPAETEPQASKPDEIKPQEPAAK
jgi:hypothetical protein